MQKAQKNCSRLDTIETNAHFYSSYREKLLGDITSEYQSTYALYSHFDTLRDNPRVEILESCRTKAYFMLNEKTRLVKIASNACRLRWCPICAKAKSKAVSASVTNYLKTNTQAKFLTLTLQHSNAPLPQQIENLYTSFREFRRLKFFKDACNGGIWFFQIKKSKTDSLWHPHLHCVIDSGYIGKQWISDQWRRITKGSKIVDIRAVYDVSKAANYVARYSSRPSNLAGLELTESTELFTALHGRRLCGKWGTAKHVDLSGQRSPDKKDSVRLCNFKTILDGKSENTVMRTLWLCWCTQVPLPEKYNLAYFGSRDRDLPDSQFYDFIIDEVYSDD